MKQATTTCLLFIFFSFSLNAQTYPDISGTWYQNGNSAYPAYIIQNGQYLTLLFNNSTSSGNFTATGQVYATTWNTYATISADRNTLTWSNQTWVRANISYPNIGGTWTVSGSNITISQNGKNLEFVMSNGRSKGYFYSANGIYAIDWNTYATYDATTKSIKWNNQTWTPGNSTGPSGTTKVCRKELSMFFYAMNALGTTWIRPAYEPGAMSARTITDVRAALSIVAPTLSLFPCIGFDRTRITNLSARLNILTGQQASKESEQIILDLQLAVRNAKITCDRGLNLEQLYVAGIHLGAAQAHSSTRICQPVPMPVNLQNAISAHLTTASNALSTTVACFPDLQLANFGAVPLASMNSSEPHNFIVGLITQTLWAVTLTDCCCLCEGVATPSTGSTCDDKCDKWCKQQGKNGGKFNGLCLLGIPSGTSSTECQCW